MCGIVGAVNWGNRETLSRATELQRHRGPDDHGVWDTRLPDGTWVGLGNRRLAVIDLSSAGHMPMTGADGSNVITYNGEVYNFNELRTRLAARGHIFSSGTDTEVVLRLYEEEGPNFLRRLNGMFALAIWDGHRRQLLLARDHFGVKPLYYTHQPQRIAFASEVKAILALTGESPSIDLKALSSYLTFLWVPDPLTMFRGIVKLPPGHYALFKEGHLEIRQYWDVTFPPASAQGAFDEPRLAEAVKHQFQSAVERQMIADVPLGAFLSAGLDSSSIVAMMAESSDRPVRTYTIAFPSSERKGKFTLDDPAVARRTAQALGCEHSEIVVEPNVVDLLPRLAWYLDEPIADPAVIMAYLVCREARKNVTVMLSGMGGDEVFGGYRKYVAYYLANLYRHLPASVREGVIRRIVLALGPMKSTHFADYVRLARKMVNGASLPPEDAFLMHGTYLTEPEKAQLCVPDVAAMFETVDPWEQHRAHFDRVRDADFLHQMMYVDMKTFLVSLNLTYNDKMSMMSSVEVRVPFLDRDLVEFVATQVPPSLKVSGTFGKTTKHIFRSAMRDVLPREVLRQPKAGFGAPIDQWLMHDLREMVDDLLHDDVIRRRGYFRPEVVRRWIEEDRAGRSDWSMQIWQLLTFELFHRAFMN